MSLWWRPTRRAATRSWRISRAPGPRNTLAVFSTTRSYDPAPDGKHIVALMPADAPQEREGRVVFLLNFFDELRRRAPLSLH